MSIHPSDQYQAIKTHIRSYSLTIVGGLVSTGLIGLAAVTKANTLLKPSLLVTGLVTTVSSLVNYQIKKEYSELFEDYDYTSRESRLNRLRNNSAIEVVNAELVKEESNKDITIPEISKNWLVEIALKSNHFRINGESGSGKTTLIANLIDVLIAELSQNNDAVDIIWIDPKYPFNETSVEPKYKGIRQALIGLSELANTVELRLDEAFRDAESNRPVRTFNPMIFVIDEIDWIVSEYGKKAIELLKVGLKVGRALNIKVCYVGQSPLSSDLKMRRNDFKHSTSIFVGSNAIAGIDEVSYTYKQKKALLVEIQNRELNGQEYFALVKAKGSQAFTVELPKPHSFRPATQIEQSLEGSEHKALDSVQDCAGIISTHEKPLVLESAAQSTQIQKSDDEIKLEAIKELTDKGEKRITVIVCQVWSCNHGTSAYKRARSEYKRLTGI